MQEISHHVVHILIPDVDLELLVELQQMLNGNGPPGTFGPQALGCVFVVFFCEVLVDSLPRKAKIIKTHTCAYCARKILHEQERSTCLEAAAKGKSGKFSKPISHISERAGFLGR